MSMEPSNLFTFEEKVRLSKAETERIRRTPGPAGHPICGIVVGSSWHEPVACAYPPGHDGDHSWASIPALPPLCAREDTLVPEGDRRCGVFHRESRATCMKRMGHDGPHATPQGHWIDGPWCDYPAAREEALT